MKSASKLAFVTVAAILFVGIAIAQEPPAPTPAPKPAAPPVAAAPLVTEAKIVIEDKAEADGKIEIVFTPAQGAPQTVTVLVAKKMKGKDVAEDLAKNLKVTLGEGWKVEQNDEKVEIQGKDKQKFSLAVGSSTVSGMSVKIK